MKRARHWGSHGYPLWILFVLVAAFAVTAAMVAPAIEAVARGRVDRSFVAGVVGIMVVASMSLGAIIGLYHYRRLRGLAWGTLTGLIIGLLAGPLLLVPPQVAGQLVFATIGGSAVVVLIGVVARLTSPRQPLSLGGESTPERDSDGRDGGERLE